MKSLYHKVIFGSSRVVLLFVFVFSFISLIAQDVDEIKANKDYIWGEGKGMTLNKADKLALDMLISQISTHVKSNTTFERNETSGGNDGIYTEDFQSVVETYSQATLNNTERFVIGNEPDAHVFRYIKRSEVKKVFEQRKNKILEFVNNAVKAEKNLQIADALRYNYWAIVLLKSHPYAGEIYYRTMSGENQLLLTYLPVAINQIFDNLKFSVAEVKKEENLTTVILDVKYKNQSVTNFDYSFFSGKNWSNIVSARDGQGFMDFYGVDADVEKIQLKAEYIFEGESRIDRELEDVMKKIEHVSFRKSYYNFNVDQKADNNEKPKQLEIAKIAAVESTEQYQSTLDKVFQAVETKQYASVKQMFTDNGYDAFTKLLQYGNARILAKNDIKYLAFNDLVLARSVSIAFSFSNNKQFVENVGFEFDANKKISNITFALTERAANDILGKDMWSKEVRLTLTNFLETYKTAYALKRLDYVESIFADDALIIVGHEVKVKQTKENQYKNNKIVQYNRYNKQQYIENLKYSFSGKEFINLKFEDSYIRTSAKSPSTYGIQIKQNYYSSNYGDVGYLFLLVDLKNPTEPIIHVRTWQPHRNADGSIYGLSDF